ncbi:MAG: cupin domain-containing protein [Gemmatimonadota bacterium]|jgi:mannose-6-phosphate isomerase-like protein (cupin superfamily)
MARRPVNLAEKFALVPEPWSPRVVAELNDYQFKIARIQGEFIWHAHPDTDEAFIVLAGEMEIELRDGPVKLGAGELFVVPRGVEHRPVAAEECHILMVEPRGVRNTGDAGGERTVENDVWV